MRQHPLTKDEKKMLAKTLESIKLLPIKSGRLTIHFTEEGAIGTIEFLTQYK